MTARPSLASRRRDARRAADTPIPFKLAETRPSAHVAIEAPRSSADVCRANGWRPGDRLTNGTTTVTLTAVGEQSILVRHGNNGECAYWSLLSYDEWRKLHECAACGADCDGLTVIHRDGAGHGPLVPICEACTKRHDEGDPAATWAAIKARLAAGEAVGS